MPCYGDNLCVPRDHVQDEGVDLICPDPPFNSNANVLFKSPTGHNNDAQIWAFEHDASPGEWADGWLSCPTHRKSGVARNGFFKASATP
jgi:hypothetical protein